MGAICSLGVRTWKINDMKEKQEARLDGENSLRDTLEARDTRNQKPGTNLLAVFTSAKV